MPGRGCFLTRSLLGSGSGAELLGGWVGSTHWLLIGCWLCALCWPQAFCLGKIRYTISTSPIAPCDRVVALGCGCSTLLPCPLLPKPFSDLRDR
ncbi:hypothetical protein H6G51_18385 [Limnothrix sp. FACHB-708]|nr:hypothetical protein [Limnothrix sp. FACHB-708]MBD2592694.1 hypothetical protein [Limnothrix sp. FACHB-406]